MRGHRAAGPAGGRSLRTPATLALAALLAAGCGEGTPSGNKASRNTGQGTASRRLEDSDAAPKHDEPSGPLFADETAARGLALRIETGATGERWLVETMLGGLGWIDYDGDGDLDLYVANGHADPVHADRPGNARNRLFANDGHGRFEDVTEASGAGDRRYSFGVAAGDVDGDGRSDLLVTNYGRDTLYRNRGGTFEDVTERTGLADEGGWSTSAAFLDYDLDGDLDIYVARYLVYRPGTSRPCRERGARVYCHPRFFSGAPDLLYENRGDGRFREVGDAAGIAGAGPGAGKGLGVVVADVDRDGWPDIFVANDTTPNFLWRNRGDGSFQATAFALGAAVSDVGKARAGMGVNAGDVDGDGRVDLHVTNFSGELDALFLARPGDTGFRDASRAAGLGPTRGRLAFGAVLEDLDLDGDLDIAVANGHVDDRVGELAPESGIEHAQPPDLWLGDGRGAFRRASPDALAAGGDDAGPRPRPAGAAFGRAFVGRGLADADIDGDGDRDLALSTLDRGVVLLVNQTDTPGRSVVLRLRGTRSNPDAYGAHVRARVGGRTVLRICRSARSYLSACDPRVVIGLGDAPAAEDVRVLWPSGREQELGRIGGGRRVVVEEE